MFQSEKEEKLLHCREEVQFSKKVFDKGNGEIEVTSCDMLNELKAYKKLDVYVSGSNAKGLSSDIATEFRGRATEIQAYTFCFEAFYSFVGGDDGKASEQFIIYGGMQRVIGMQDEKDKKVDLTSL